MTEPSLFSKLAVSLRGNRALSLIVLAALVLRLAAFLYVQPWKTDVFTKRILVEDAPMYHALALDIAQERSFASFNPLRTPVYPGFLAAVYIVTGTRPWLVLLLQIGLSVLSLLLLYRLGRLVYPSSKTAALIACALFAIEPHNIYYSISLLTETVFLFFLLASVLLLVSGLEHRSLAQLAASGLCLGLLLLTRPVAQFLPPILLALIFLYTAAPLVFRLKGALLFLLLFAAALTPWLARNYALYRHASLCTIGPYNLLFYNVFYAELPRSGRSFEQLTAAYEAEARRRGAYASGNPFDTADVYRTMAYEHIRKNPGLIAIRHAKGMLNMFTNLGASNLAEMYGLRRTTAVYRYFEFDDYRKMIIWFFKNKTPHEIAVGFSVAFFLLLTYLAAARGAAILASRRYHFAVLMAMIGYFVVITGALGSSRLRVPIVPFYLIMSGIGFAAVIRKDRSPAAALIPRRTT